MESSICATIAEVPKVIHAHIPNVERRYAKGNMKSGRDTGSWSRVFGVIYAGLLVIKLFGTMTVRIVSWEQLMGME